MEKYPSDFLGEKLIYEWLNSKSYFVACLQNVLCCLTVYSIYMESKAHHTEILLYSEINLVVISYNNARLRINL